MSVPQPPDLRRAWFRVLGPGLVVAATGVGAGDLVAAGKAGATYGLAVLWVAVLGALLKFALNEGVARWHLATGTTVLEGWVRHLPRAVHVYFLAYLAVWTFVVSAALMSACGLAAHALAPFLSVNAWAILHGLAGLAFVWFGGYRGFERIMAAMVGIMFVAIIGGAAVQSPPPGEVFRGLLVPAVPAGSLLLLLGLMGGVGGSVTLLSYNYWIAERRWAGPAWLPATRLDLGAGYLFTGLFGAAMVLLTGVVLHPRGITLEGSRGILDLASILGERFGKAGEIVFVLGFWGAVASSVLGVWQGVPYLFADFVRGLRDRGEATARAPVSARCRTYRGYLLYLSLPPMALLFLEQPVWLVVIYAAVGSLFMPFLAATLLVLNNRAADMGPLRNGLLANGALVLILLLFAYLGFDEMRDALRR